MTPREKLIVAQPDISLEDARRILHDIRKEKLREFFNTSMFHYNF